MRQSRISPSAGFKVSPPAIELAARASEPLGAQRSQRKRTNAALNCDSYTVTVAVSKWATANFKAV